MKLDRKQKNDVVLVHTFESRVLQRRRSDVGLNTVRDHILKLLRERSRLAYGNLLDEMAKQGYPTPIVKVALESLIMDGTIKPREFSAPVSLGWVYTVEYELASKGAKTPSKPQ